jgi:hypothetical protein
MRTLPFGGGREITMSIEGPQGLIAGAGLHRLMFYDYVKANPMPTGVPVTLSGEAFLSGGMHDWLGTWAVEHQPVTRDDGQPDVVMILLPLTDQQLAVIEHRRAGADVQIQLNVDVALGHHPLADGSAGKDIWPQRTFQETIFVQPESWVRLLTQAPVGTSLAVVVPVPLHGASATRVGTLLRDAIEKVNKGECGDAVTAARRAIDAMGTGWVSEKSIVRDSKERRSLDQRLSLLRHALHGLASPSAHGDPVADAKVHTGSMDYDLLVLGSGSAAFAAATSRRRKLSHDAARMRSWSPSPKPSASSGSARSPSTGG